MIESDVIVENESMTDEEALQSFLLDIDCLNELLPWSSDFSVFDVLGISKNENKHSNMLAWLFNPEENHGIKDLFLRGFLQKMIENDSDNRYDIFSLLLMDFNSFTVYREWKNIDILLVSQKEKYILVIENKIATHEHDDQLNRYRKIITDEFTDYEKAFIYLTPNRDEASDYTNWDSFSYSDIGTIISDILNNNTIQDEQRLFIEDYLNLIRRDIVEDERLVDICNKIYSKHKRALDLIYEHRTDIKTQKSIILLNTLEEIEDEGLIISWNDSSYGSFTTKKMDNVLNPLKEGNGSWSSNSLYFYWFRIKEGKLACIFELGGANVPDKEKTKMDKMIKKEKGVATVEPFKYKRLYRTKWYTFSEEDNIEDEMRLAIRNAVDDVLEYEKRLLSDL